MLGISLIFVGITLILNGIFFYSKNGKNESMKKEIGIIILNFFTGFLVLLFNFSQILIETDSLKLVGFFGGLLFGLTNLLIAFDLLFNSTQKITGIYSFLAMISALILGAFYFIKLDALKGVAWILWSFIWLFYFIYAAITPKFLKANAIMLFVQGIVTTYLFGVLQLLEIIKF